MVKLKNRRIKEYRINLKGSSQGNYVIATSKKQAISRTRRFYNDKKGHSSSNSDFEGMLWKTGKDNLHLMRTNAALKRSGQLPKTKTRKEQQRIKKVIKSWNDGKYPKTKQQKQKMLDGVQHELSSGYHAPHQDRVQELRDIRSELKTQLLKNPYRKKKTGGKKVAKRSKRSHKQDQARRSKQGHERGKRAPKIGNPRYKKTRVQRSDGIWTHVYKRRKETKKKGKKRK